MRYTDIWIHLLNSVVEDRARAWLDQQLRRVLGPGSARLPSAFFDDKRELLQAMREAWVRQKGLGADTAELTTLLELADGAAGSGTLDGLLAPGAGQAPANAAQLGEQLVRAALLGFAAYLHDQAYAEEPSVVDRCAGLCQIKAAPAAWDQGSAFPLLAEAELVERQLGVGINGDFARCGKLFVRIGRGDFCSKACRDRNFALSRRQRNPRYDADKQKRYRERQKAADSVAAR